MASAATLGLGWSRLDVIGFLTHRRLPWFYLATGFLLATWLIRVWLLFESSGLFRVLGIDWSMYVSQAQLLRSGEGHSIYDLGRLDAYLQPLRAYTTAPEEPLSPGPVAYPPVFAWLMLPFTFVPPPLGLGLWTLLNLAGLVHLARRAAAVVPGVGPLKAFLALLIWFPVALGLVVGQPTTLLGCAMAECYLSLRAGRDVRGGLWLSVLLLKPQYGVLIGPILIWKRRWRAVLGVALGGLAMVAASALVVGVPTLLTYGAAVADIAPWGGAALSSPGQMINWRALILNVRPSIGPSTGLLLTALLGLVTVGCTLPVWRGPWSAGAATFPSRMAVTSLATILANYHSHVHGLTLFTLPLAASLGHPHTRRATRWALLAVLFGPTLVIIALQHWLIREVIFHQPVDVLIWSPLVQMLLTLATGSLLFELLRRPRASAVVEDPSPTSVPASEHDSRRPAWAARVRRRIWQS